MAYILDIMAHFFKCPESISLNSKSLNGFDLIVDNFKMELKEQLKD